MQVTAKCLDGRMSADDSSAGRSDLFPATEADFGDEDDGRDIVAARKWKGCEGVKVKLAHRYVSGDAATSATRLERK